MNPPVTVQIKRTILGVATRMGLLARVRDSQWRAHRLLILCYHSISMADEHEWNGLYSMSPALLAARFRLLSTGGYRVLPLDEALPRMYEGTLPPRSVSLTFDDGLVDFRERALPLLRAHGFPATVYLTTYYSDINAPVFGLFCSYLLWRARAAGRVDGSALMGRETRWDVASVSGRARAEREIRRHVARARLSASDRARFTERLATLLGEDYEALARMRLLSLMSNEEAAEVGRSGVDVQLHSHRHRVPNDRALFLREIGDNRARIDPIRATPARHFCYPDGEYRPQFLPWLEAAGVEFATTCDPGLASPASSPLLLPRLVDSEFLSERDVEGWLAGVSAFFMPRKATTPAPASDDDV